MRTGTRLAIACDRLGEQLERLFVGLDLPQVGERQVELLGERVGERGLVEVALLDQKRAEAPRTARLRLRQERLAKRFGRDQLPLEEQVAETAVAVARELELRVGNGRRLRRFCPAPSAPRMGRLRRRIRLGFGRARLAAAREIAPQQHVSVPPTWAATLSQHAPNRCP